MHGAADLTVFRPIPLSANPKSVESACTYLCTILYIEHDVGRIGCKLQPSLFLKIRHHKVIIHFT